MKTCLCRTPRAVPSWKVVPIQKSVAVADKWLSYPSERWQGLSDVTGDYAGLAPAP